MVDFYFIVGNENDSTRNCLGRKFIHERYPDVKYMYHDYVLCKNFETEEEALQFERYIADKCNLFES